jgi:tight adherence protein C
MWWQFAILALVFGFVFVLVMWVSSILAARRRRLEQRLGSQGGSDSQLGSDPSAPSGPDLVLGDQMTPALAGAVPMGSEDRGALQRELRAAGYYKPTALMEYAAIRACLILLPLIGAAGLALFTDDWHDAVWFWGAGVLLAILGFSLPRVYIYFQARARQHQIERGLPTAIDMITLCLSAGLNLSSSLERVTGELRFAYPVLAEEFAIMRRQAELKSLEFALIQFAERVNMPQIRNLQVLLAQSQSLGTDAVGVLREYADDLRVNMRQRADEMANKAPFKLLFPAYLMAFGAGILLISPAALEFQNFRHRNLIGTNLDQIRGFLESEDKSLKEAFSPKTPDDPDLNTPRDVYLRRGGRDARIALEGLDETDEAKAKQKPKATGLPFLPKSGR